MLRLQHYTQSSVASRPFPKLAFKFFGPYTVLEKIGAVAYRLQLPEHSKIHPVFHISQLKPFTSDYTPVFSELHAADLQAADAVPEQVLQRRRVRKGNHAIMQVLVTWTGLPSTSSTWEDYTVVRSRFPDAPAWGQADSSAGGGVATQ